jgi:hypothetical protein
MLSEWDCSAGERSLLESGNQRRSEWLANKVDTEIEVFRPLTATGIPLFELPVLMCKPAHVFVHLQNNLNGNQKNREQGLEKKPWIPKAEGSRQPRVFSLPVAAALEVPIIPWDAGIEFERNQIRLG